MTSPANAAHSTHDVGPQYKPDDAFKAAARLHQSRYRAEVLRVGFNTYGNRLLDADGTALRNYYDQLGVRDMLRARYPAYKQERDADLLRSEHIPFNLIGPLATNLPLAADILSKACSIDCAKVHAIHIEYAPVPNRNHLNDQTSFDAFALCTDGSGSTLGLGIEVKYTEHAYPIGRKERSFIADPESPYWTVARASEAFITSGDPILGSDDYRQIWRNHLLGLSMIRPLRGAPVLQRFKSVTLYPAGNTHFRSVMPAYAALLSNAGRSTLGWVTYESFFAAIHGSREFEAWRAWLERRYLA